MSLRATPLQGRVRREGILVVVEVLYLRANPLQVTVRGVSGGSVAPEGESTAC